MLSSTQFKWAIGVGAAVLVCAVVIALALPSFEPLAKKWLIGALEKRYQSDVQIREFHASLLPYPRATVEGVTLRFHRRTDVPPLAEIRKIVVEAGLGGILESPVHIRKVTLEGLVVSIPRRNDEEAREKPRKNPKANFVLREVVADGTFLRVLPSKPGKNPLDFEIRKLTLHSAAVDRPMDFTAELTNPKPPGLIHSAGQFGPWNAMDPGESPVNGKYTFRDADLSIFKGIAGILSSDGTYQGKLNRIECEGTTDTPDFTVASGNPVDLKTRFRAVVDGTDGDTKLDSVNASFLNTQVSARGVVEGLPEHKGKKVALAVAVEDGRVEDLLHLVVKGRPMLTGSVAFHTAFDLPPGPAAVMDKLNLNGKFGIAGGKFTSPAVQGKIEGLSHRAKGDPKQEETLLVASDFAGNLTLDNGVANFSRLAFSVPGAKVELSGTYGVDTQAIDLHGAVRTEAKISEMTTGVKSFLLKAVDPLFKKDQAGAVIPIAITGTRADPKFGLELRKKK